MRLRQLLLVMTLVSATLALHACARTSTAAGRIVIAVVPMATTDEYWRAIHAGAEKAGKDLNVEIVWQGPMRHDDRSAQIDVVENMIVRGVNGIVLAPVDNMALRGPVEDAYRSGIPVTVVDSDLHSDRYISFIATDNYEGGVMAGEHLAKLLNGKGKVAMLRGTEGNSSTDHREKGFLDAIAKHTDIQVVSENQHGGATSETAYRASENLLAPLKTKGGAPSVDGIFCPSESTTFGMLRALQDGGLAGKVRFVGFDFSSKLNEALSKGEIDALIIQNPVEMGFLGVKSLVDKLQGKAVEKLVHVPATVATHENCHDAAIHDLLQPPIGRWLHE